MMWPVRLVWQTVFLAIGQVWANKIRAILTALGIIIGVFAVITVMSALGSMKGFVLSEFEKFGAKKMWVWGEIPDDLEGVLSWSDVKMTRFEARQIRDLAPSIEMLTPMTFNSWDASFGKTMVRGAPTRGIWPEWHAIEDRQVIYGRPFSRIDNEERRQVCLVNEQAIEELQLDIDPVGDYILLQGRRFLIIGVVETKEQSGMFGGGQPRTELYIPFNTHKMMNPYTGTWLMCQMVDPDRSEDARAEIRFILRNIRQLQPEDEDTFDMFILQSEIENFNKVAGFIGTVALIVVGISLAVGGIGIMNIMLVSVSERTREIGLRKAMGAQPLVVLLQFLVEAVMLCLVGGLVGVGLAVGMIMLVSLIPDLPVDNVAVSKLAVVIALTFSAGVGVIFGMFPAIKAAILNPIDALRHE